MSLRTSVGLSIIVPAIPSFMQKYPDLTVEVSLTDEKLDIIAANIDVAVWLGVIPDSEIVARRLSPTQRIVCAAPAYLERAGTPQVPEDLRGHNCLLFAGRRYRRSWAFTRDGGCEEIEVQGNFRTDSGSVLFAAALGGGGVIARSIGGSGSYSMPSVTPARPI